MDYYNPYGEYGRKKAKEEIARLGEKAGFKLKETAREERLRLKEEAKEATRTQERVVADLESWFRGQVEKMKGGYLEPKEMADLVDLVLHGEDGDAEPQQAAIEFTKEEAWDLYINEDRKAQLLLRKRGMDDIAHTKAQQRDRHRQVAMGITHLDTPTESGDCSKKEHECRTCKNRFYSYFELNSHWDSCHPRKPESGAAKRKRKQVREKCTSVAKQHVPKRERKGGAS
ncbi:hypothetical protein CYMTET_44399 [Cymbomonas tetramitiformis]|uniref:C2H2-type domain-containing protein n=1 Tax=Cymbomonas tetramitiformis TaxID=36881 RepID=A0AAE0EZM8_9CHLO|nr:hypothetical protein CYMTET_44399 [Cymbomonas tetramitiformis]